MNGLLLVNLGTPDAPTTAAVRRYLAEFLWDHRVLSMHAVPRALLLYGAILPFRPAKSAEAYRTVWDPVTGSPLLHHSMSLTAAVRAALGQDWTVALGMRYGKPGLAGALQTLEDAGCDRIFVQPLYPQYASSSTGSTVERLMGLAAARPATPNLSVLPEFYEDPDFIASFAEVARPRLEAFQPDHVLMSYHGLPEDQVKATQLGAGGHCLSAPGCCDSIRTVNSRCYRAQSFATTRALSAALGLGPDQVTVSFQSRLGRTPWIKPYTDMLLPELAAKHKRLAVMCPSFVSDCLETLEEIGVRAKEEYAALGGTLELIPCPNSSPRWVQALADRARRAAGLSPSVPRASA
jgi:ferrochelatase